MILRGKTSSPPYKQWIACRLTTITIPPHKNEWAKTNRRGTVTIVISNNKNCAGQFSSCFVRRIFLLIVLISFIMGTNLNKKNEKRKNINRIIVGTRYKKERMSNKARLTNWPSPKPLPQREGSNHRDTPHV